MESALPYFAATRGLLAGLLARCAVVGCAAFRGGAARVVNAAARKMAATESFLVMRRIVSSEECEIEGAEYYRRFWRGRRKSCPQSVGAATKRRDHTPQRRRA